MTMTFKQFIEKFDDYWSYPYKAKQKDNYNLPYEQRIDKTKPRLEVSWTTGGACGGNCWNDNPPESHMLSAEPEPEMENLDKILQEVAPNLTYLQYRMISGLLKRDEHTEWEYYGNYTNSAEKSLDARELYDTLVMMGYLQEV